jgi:uncharacterized protein
MRLHQIFFAILNLLLQLEWLVETITADSRQNNRRMGTKKLDFSIVVIGRRNHRKKSHGIEKFILEASQYVNKAIYFSSDKEKYAIEINNAISCNLNKLPKVLSCISHAIFQNTTGGKLARRISQFLYLACNPKLIIKVVKAFWHKKSHLEQLEAAIKSLDDDRVIIVAHSAGGILAAQAQHLEKIVACICFGYPFKHPEKDEENYRTEPLQNITKPFLIFQGNEDEYGSALKVSDYATPPSIRCISIDADHDCAIIQEQDYKKIFDIFSNLLK